MTNAITIITETRLLEKKNEFKLELFGIENRQGVQRFHFSSFEVVVSAKRIAS